MVIFFGDGRLGNQLFQYSFIKSVEDKENTIVSYGFEDILELFDTIPNLINIQNRNLKFLIRKFYSISLTLILIMPLFTNVFFQNIINPSISPSL